MKSEYTELLGNNVQVIQSAINNPGVLKPGHGRGFFQLCNFLRLSVYAVWFTFNTRLAVIVGRETLWPYG